MKPKEPTRPNVAPVRTNSMRVLPNILYGLVYISLETFQGICLDVPRGMHIPQVTFIPPSREVR